MRCLACGTEMNVMDVVQDDTMPVPGFEHRTFNCAACGDIERRLVFRQIGQSDNPSTPAHAAPSISPEIPTQEEEVPGEGMSGEGMAARGLRVIEKYFPF